MYSLQVTVQGLSIGSGGRVSLGLVVVVTITGAVVVVGVVVTVGIAREVICVVGAIEVTCVEGVEPGASG
jgi:hypothetical protein